MANDLDINRLLRVPALTPSLPPSLVRLSSCLGTVEWPGQPRRWHFPSGMEITDQQRTELTTQRDNMRRMLDHDHPNPTACSKARFALLATVLMAYPAAGVATEMASDARRDVYLGALSDVPPWAIKVAMDKWARGEVGTLPDVGPLNYSFAPSPAVMRKAALKQLDPYRECIATLDRLLAAMPLKAAMDPAPIEMTERVNTVLAMPRRM